MSMRDPQQGFGGMVNVKLTVDESAITAIEITGDGETPTLGGAAMETMAQAYVGQSDAEAVDSVSGSTITSEAVKTAVASALAAARGEVQETAEIAFTPGTYEGTGARLQRRRGAERDVWREFHR